MKTRAPTARPTDFYQLDLEMSFVEQEDVFAAVQPVIQGVFEEFGGGRSVDPDWPQISYRDSLLWYGTDKPDLRNPIKMQVVSPSISQAPASRSSPNCWNRTAPRSARFRRRAAAAASSATG